MLTLASRFSSGFASMPSTTPQTCPVADWWAPSQLQVAYNSGYQASTRVDPDPAPSTTPSANTFRIGFGSCNDVDDTAAVCRMAPEPKASSAFAYPKAMPLRTPGVYRKQPCRTRSSKTLSTCRPIRSCFSAITFTPTTPTATSHAPRTPSTPTRESSPANTRNRAPRPSSSTRHTAPTSTRPTTPAGARRQTSPLGWPAPPASRRTSRAAAGGMGTRPTSRSTTPTTRRRGRTSPRP